MNSPITIIDCAVQTHEHIHFNRMISRMLLPMTYHAPALLGMKSLEYIEETSGIVIFGSASNLEDNLFWHKEVASFVMSNLSHDVPVLGICFGHQLMANTFGCEVDFRLPDKSKYRGAREIKILKNSFGILEGTVLKVALSHSQEVKTLSPNMLQIAYSSECKYEGLAHKTLPYWGFQCHPEVSRHYIQNQLKISDINEIFAILKSGDTIMDRFLCEVLRRSNKEAP